MKAVSARRRQSRAGTRLAVRCSGAATSGSQGHDETQDWVEGYFRKYGLKDIHRKPFDLPPQWIAKSYEIAFSSGGTTIELHVGAPGRGLAVDAAGRRSSSSSRGSAWAATPTYIGRDVKGKAVLIQTSRTPGVLRHSITSEGAVQRAFDKGAAAVGMVYGISDNFTLWELRTQRQARVLRRLRRRHERCATCIGKGETVKVKIAARVRGGADLKTASVLGTLPGTTDEDIIIIAHMDGYFDGAIDNGSGLAVMMGLLEHFSKVPQAERKRNISFLGSAGHHGGPGTRWLHDERETELAKTALIDQPRARRRPCARSTGGRSCARPTRVSPMRWWVWGSPKLLDIALQVVRALQRGPDRRHGHRRVGRDGPGGARRAVDAGDHLAGGEAHRGGHRGVGAGRRAWNRSAARTRRSSTK